MQRLSSLFLIFVAAFATFFSPNLVNAQSAQDTTNGIMQLTTVSGNLNNLTTGIDPITVFIRGPQVAQTFGQIVISVGTLTATFSGATPYTDPEAMQVVGALREFVTVHQMLLATVSGKHGILAQFQFAEPVRIVLVKLEAAVDAFALGLLPVIPTQAPAGMSAKMGLDQSLNSTIAVYSS